MNAQLHIHAAIQRGKTFLKDSFYTNPFKLANITEDKNDETLRLMLMSSSPGVLDNDEYEIRIELDEECSVQLQTQSYQRLFQMRAGAKQVMEVIMKGCSSFVFLPHPSVPHESSIFSAKNIFSLSDECFLIWGEVLTCGRKLNGEVFRFSTYHSQTEIYVSDKLIMKENLLLTPGAMDLNAIGQLEGYTHQASFTCIDAKLHDNATLESIHELLLMEKDICYGLSAFSANGFTIRLLGYKAEQLHSILKSTARFLTDSKIKREIIKLASHAK